MPAEPFPTVASPKSREILFRGARFTLTISDDAEHPGHIEVRLHCDAPPRGLDGELYALHMRPPDGRKEP